MRRPSTWSLLVATLAITPCVPGQTGTGPSARLELTLDVATTTNEGLPETLRFTLKNVGGEVIRMPMPALDCGGAPSGSIVVISVAHRLGAGTGGHGHGCGGSWLHGELLNEIRTKWINLRSGEYLVFTGDRRLMVDQADGRASYEYWAEYLPPSLSVEEREQARANGYAVPAEQVDSEHLDFTE